MCDAIQRHRVTFLPFVPALLNTFALERRSGGKDLDVSSVDSIVLGGDVITRDALLKAGQEFPQARLLHGHGMTEGGGLFEWPFGETKVEDVPCYREILPLGKVMKGARVRIRDTGNGKICRRGESGELVLNCKSIIKRYLDDAHQDAFLQEDGRQWFRTGDLALMNDDGLVYILGRVKDRIKRAGIPIEPAALEDCVAAFTGSPTCVIGWPHPQIGAVPLAIVEDMKGKTADEVKEEVLRKFGKDYALEHVMSLEQLGLQTWPLNPTGKVMKMELRPKVEEFLNSKR